MISILLWSRNSPLVTCLRFDRQESITGLPSMIGLPTELLLPIPANGKALLTAAISVRQLESEGADEGLSISMHSLQLLTDDLALHHAFLCRSSDSVKEPPQHIASARMHLKSAPIARDDDDDFIVPDELSQKKARSRSKTVKSHKIKYRTEEKSGKNKHTQINATVDNQVIISKISGISENENRQEIIDIANELQDLILDEDFQGLGEPSKTLLEQRSNPVPHVGELAEASHALSNLLSLSRLGPVPDEPGVAVKRLQIPTWASPMGVAPEQLEFGGLYNHIVEHQLAPLADEIPPRLRMGREKLARQIAAQVVLSSSRVEMVDPQLEESQEQEETQQSLPSFHGKGKGKLTVSFPVSSQLSDYMSSQTLPTPSPSASRAASTIMSGTTTSLPSAASQSIISRLSRHVEFKPSTSTWAKRPMALLAHWDIGADPNTYNYSQTLGELERQKQEESMTDKQRLKAREKAERRLKRQRREAEKARGALMSSQPMVMSSQAHRGGSQARGGSQFGGGSQIGGSQFGGSEYGRSTPPLPSSPPPMLDRERERGFAMSSQMVAPPMVGSSQAPVKRGDGPAKRKKRKREGF